MLINASKTKESTSLFLPRWLLTSSSARFGWSCSCHLERKFLNASEFPSTRRCKKWWKKIATKIFLHKFLRYTLVFINLIIAISIKNTRRRKDIFASLFSKSKEQHLWNMEKCFLFNFKTSFRSWDNQIFSDIIYKNYIHIYKNFSRYSSAMTSSNAQAWP